MNVVKVADQIFSGRLSAGAAKNGVDFAIAAGAVRP